MKLLYVVLFSLVVIFIFACEQMESKTVKGFEFLNIERIEDNQWAKLSQSRVYFGHQSVGYNIVEGMNDICRELKPKTLNIQDSFEALASSIPVFAHSTIGENTLPLLKIDDFKDKISGINGNVDIAFLKLCYVDITKDTDIVNVFNHYKKVLSGLQHMYPTILFIHFSVPLTVDEKGIKATIKRIIGRKVRGYEDNIARHRFNELMRAEYDGKEAFFDLAEIESTDTNGNQTIYEMNGKEYATLYEDYTDDGGHLNELGRNVVAGQLLIFIMNLLA
jgi:hypothetical protein